MTKRELVDIVARKAHLTKRAAEEAINVFLSEIGRALGKTVQELKKGMKEVMEEPKEEKKEEKKSE